MLIHLISGPRNISTALMYSFAQRKDTAVVDEPFYAYYLKVSGVKHPGREEVLRSLPNDVDAVIEQHILNNREEEHLFIKNMAHHVSGIPVDFSPQMVHVFLIRNPYDLIASFCKVIENPTLKDIGLADEAALYNQLKNMCTCVVVNSDDLLQNPPNYLKKLCEQIGISFDENMLKWPAGARKEDGVWAKYWYASVHKSTGFGSHKRAKNKLPNRLLPLYEEAKFYFDQLNIHAIKI